MAMLQQHAVAIIPEQGQYDDAQAGMRDTDRCKKHRQ